VAKLTRLQLRILHNALNHAKRAQAYIQHPETVIAKKEKYATTTLHCVNQRGDILYAMDKEIGDITGLYDAVRILEIFLKENTDLKPTIPVCA
jgi:hypothetical protein